MKETLLQRVNFFRQPGHLKGCVKEPCRGSWIILGKTKFLLLLFLLLFSYVYKFVALLCVKNKILMDISGTKENGKFDSGENLDIDVRMFLTKYGSSKRWLHDRVLH